MEEYFNKFISNIELTPSQKEDAKIKYKWVCKKIHDSFYDTKYDGSTKYLFGSYKKKTNIRPIIQSQDVDVLIKLPLEVYEKYDELENGQSQLIQKIKAILKEEKYTTTDNIKWWWKVILVEFADGKHNVELLPAFENQDGTFEIPNSSGDGTWETFDIRTEIDEFLESNIDTKWFTRVMCKIIKTWARTVGSLSIKSFKIEEHVIDFLSGYAYEDKKISIIVQDFFDYLLGEISEVDKSYVNTAFNRASKAIEYISEEKYEKAVDEWRKIFGNIFPKSVSVKKASLELYSSKANVPYIAPDEEFIEDMYNVMIEKKLYLELDCELKIDGFRDKLLSYFVNSKIRLPKKKQLRFFIKKHNIPWDFDIKWKVRNYWIEAENVNSLRWEISADDGTNQKIEVTRYFWDHIVECYAIKNDSCIAVGSIEVPID